MIVEDDKDWQDIYLRNAQPVHPGCARVAATLDEAAAAIAEMAFAVAFVDIRLDEADDQNTDGLRVLEILRDSRDQTSAIMLTGHGTVAITRDALKEHHAYEAIEKSAVGPEQIHDLVRLGTERCNQEIRVHNPVAPEVLRGRRAVWDWDSEMLKATGAKGGADVLYRLLESLASPFLPLAQGDDGDLLRYHEDNGLALGAYWSRAIGSAVVVAFGRSAAVRCAMDDGDVERFAGHSLGAVLRERDKGGVAGLIVAVPDRERSTFS
ncbi:MAG: response regulator [Solirubrobacterales bacterium]